MSIFTYLKDCFKEAPIDDSLCGLNKLKIENSRTNIEEDYLKQHLSEEEYVKPDLEREVFSDSHNREREEYRRLRREKDCIEKRLQK